MTGIGHLLACKNCGLTDAASSHEAPLGGDVTKEGLLLKTLQSLFQDKITWTDSPMPTFNNRALLEELREGKGKYSALLMAEGSNPFNFRDVMQLGKELNPDFKMLKAESMDRRVDEDRKKRQLFTLASRITNWLSFTSNEVRLGDSDVDDREMNYLILHRHHRSDTQQECREKHFPNAQEVEVPLKEGERPGSQLNWDSAKDVIDHIDSVGNVGACEVILPAELLVEVVEQRPDITWVKAAQARSMVDGKPVFTFSHLATLNDVKVEREFFAAPQESWLDWGQRKVTQLAQSCHVI